MLQMKSLLKRVISLFHAYHYCLFFYFLNVTLPQNASDFLEKCFKGSVFWGDWMEKLVSGLCFADKGYEQSLKIYVRILACTVLMRSRPPNFTR